MKPETSETLMGTFTKFFGSMKQTFFDGNFWYSLLSIKIFDTPNFLKHWRDAHEIFGHCDTNNLRRKNVIPLLCIKIFVTIFFSGKQKGSFTKLFVSVLWDKKNRQNRDAPPAHMHEKFWIKNFFKHKIVLHWNILAQWDKIFSTENRDNSPLSSIRNFPLPKNLWNAEWFPGEVFFGPVR